MSIKSTKHILIVGGAGFIGSHMVRNLQREGYIPIVLDSLFNGHRDSVLDAELIVGDMRDEKLLETLFSNYDFLAVMHFAGLIQVGESVHEPLKYYQNNFVGTLNLLTAMLKWHVKHFIFSSTASVYGDPQYTPIDEKHCLAPMNPYGCSKRMVEQVLIDFAKAYDLRFTILRYFNAAGCDPTEKLSERHDPETHLIPLIIQAAIDKHKAITIYGQDYATSDGTCIRDYIHVMDLCRAHFLALQALLAGKKSAIYNLGTGQGYTVKQVIDTVQRVVQRDIAIKIGPRRDGDPTILVADASLARQELGWQPQYSDLETIVRHAYQSIVHETMDLIS